MKNLMIVDMQKGLMNKNNQHLINKINAYLKEESFDKVIYTRFYNYDESQYENILDYKKMMTEEEIEFSVDSVENSIIFPKCSYGLPPEQLMWLREKNVKEVILCGTDIDCCILAIAFNLFDWGIKPVFKWDLCGSSNKNQDIKESIKHLLERNFGRDCIV